MASPEARIGLGLATATVAFAVYQRGLPSEADIRVGKPGDEHLEAIRKQNAWMAAGAVAGISLLAKDKTIFIMGALTVVGLDWLTRINNFTNPVTGSMIDNPLAIPDVEGDESTQSDYGYLSAVP